MRSSILDRIDRRLAVILGCSVAVHLGIAIYAWTGDLDTGVEAQPQTHLEYRVETMEITLPDVIEPKTVEPSKPGIAAPVAPPRAQHVTARDGLAPRAVRLDPNDEAKRLAMLLGDGGTPASARAIEMHVQRGDHGVDEIGHPERGSRPGRDVRVDGTHDHQVVQAPDLQRVEQRHRDEAPVRVQLQPQRTRTTTTLTVDDVLAQINASYLHGLERCYSRALGLDASTSGKIQIAFTVDEHGAVTDHSASGGGELGTCVAQQVSAWHFGIPHDAAGAPARASFGISLALSKG